MNTANENEALSRINNLQSILKNEFQTTSIVKKQYCFEFTVLNNSEKVKILVYFGKKGVRTVLQGNTETGLYKHVNNITNYSPALSFRQNKISFTNYIGADESGKGDIFGPLVIAAFYESENIKEKLLNTGAADSKTLSETKIMQIASAIKKEFPKHYIIKVFNPEVYNIEYEKFGNLNKLLHNVYSEMIPKLADKSKGVEKVIIDKFGNYNFNLPGNYDVELYEKGEKFPAVAAASVLARNEFNLWFAEKKIDNFVLPKGASLETQAIAVKLAKKSGVSGLSRIAKLHFKVFKNL